VWIHTGRLYGISGISYEKFGGAKKEFPYGFQKCDIYLKIKSKRVWKAKNFIEGKH
jgi:hypothetical protein